MKKFILIASLFLLAGQLARLIDNHFPCAALMTDIDDADKTEKKDSKDFVWTSTINIGKNSNKIDLPLHIPGIRPAPVMDTHTPPPDGL